MKLDPRDLLAACDLLARARQDWVQLVEEIHRRKGKYDEFDRKTLDLIDEAERVSKALAGFCEGLVERGLDPTRVIEVKARQWTGGFRD